MTLVGAKTSLLCHCALPAQYINVVEEACQKHPSKAPKELKVKASMLLEDACHPKPNITRGQFLKELKHDKSRVILTANKGVTMLVLDKQDYFNKAQDLLGQRDIYRTLVVDTNKNHKTKLINILTTIKAQEGIRDKTYKRLYKKVQALQSSMGYPNPQRTLPYNCSFKQGCSYILGGQWAGKHPKATGRVSPHHIKNPQSFPEQLRTIRLEEGNVSLSMM